MFAITGRKHIRESSTADIQHLPGKLPVHIAIHWAVAGIRTINTQLRFPQAIKIHLRGNVLYDRKLHAPWARRRRAAPGNIRNPC